jgi:hypothetical protein
MADLVEYTLDDGSTVLFESAEANLVALHGGEPEVKEGGRLAERLSSIAKTAGQVAAAMREHVGPDELELELGVKVAGEVNAWFFARQQAEATIKVTLTWKTGPAAETSMSGSSGSSRSSRSSRSSGSSGSSGSR